MDMIWFFCVILIKDNFYNNVDEMREYGLGLTYDITGNYPGQRSSDHVIAYSEPIQKLLGPKWGAITEWQTGNHSANGNL